MPSAGEPRGMRPAQRGPGRQRRDHRERLDAQARRRRDSKSRPPATSSRRTGTWPSTSRAMAPSAPPSTPALRPGERHQLRFCATPRLVKSTVERPARSAVTPAPAAASRHGAGSPPRHRGDIQRDRPQTPAPPPRRSGARSPGSSFRTGPAAARPHPGAGQSVRRTARALRQPVGGERHLHAGRAHRKERSRRPRPSRRARHRSGRGARGVRASNSTISAPLAQLPVERTPEWPHPRHRGRRTSTSPIRLLRLPREVQPEVRLVRRRHRMPAHRRVPVEPVHRARAAQCPSGRTDCQTHSSAPAPEPRPPAARSAPGNSAAPTSSARPIDPTSGEESNVEHTL
jgi:hypothetical protein